MWRVSWATLRFSAVFQASPFLFPRQRSRPRRFRSMLHGCPAMDPFALELHGAGRRNGPAALTFRSSASSSAHRVVFRQGRGSGCRYFFVPLARRISPTTKPARIWWCSITIPRASSSPVLDRSSQLSHRGRNALRAGSCLAAGLKVCVVGAAGASRRLTACIAVSRAFSSARSEEAQAFAEALADAFETSPDCEDLEAFAEVRQNRWAPFGASPWGKLIAWARPVRACVAFLDNLLSCAVHSPALPQRGLEMAGYGSLLRRCRAGQS